MAKVERNKTRSGADITPEVEDALAAEAERGYDLSEAKRVGRPSLGESGTSPRLDFRATPELYEAARLRAEQEGRSVSDIVREALARYVMPDASS